MKKIERDNIQQKEHQNIKNTNTEQNIKNTHYTALNFLLAE